MQQYDTVPFLYTFLYGLILGAILTFTMLGTFNYGRSRMHTTIAAWFGVHDIQVAEKQAEQSKEQCTTTGPLYKALFDLLDTETWTLSDTFDDVIHCVKNGKYVIIAVSTSTKNMSITVDRTPNLQEQLTKHELKMLYDKVFAVWKKLQRPPVDVNAVIDKLK